MVEEAAEAGADKRQRAMLVVLNPEQRDLTGPSVAAPQSLGCRGAGCVGSLKKRKS